MAETRGLLLEKNTGKVSCRVVTMASIRGHREIAETLNHTKE